MTRRKFIEYTLQTALAVLAGAWAFAKEVAPRLFVRADPSQKYPGKMKPLENINTQGKWSG